MIKKLTQHGNSLALIIDRPILELIGIDANTALELSTDGKCLVVTPMRNSAKRKKIDAAVDKAHRRYGSMFKRLAE